MNATLNFYGKFLVVLLAFSSLGGNLSYGLPLSEVRQKKKDSGAQFQAVQPVLLAFQEKDYQDIPDPSEDFLFGYIPFDHSSVSLSEEKEFTSTSFYFNRDIRAALTVQIFPTHFFL